MQMQFHILGMKFAIARIMPMKIIIFMLLGMQIAIAIVVPLCC